MKNDSLSETFFRVVDFLFFLKECRSAAPESEGRDIRIFPHFPEFDRKIIQKGDNRLIEGTQRSQTAHSFDDFGCADDILQFVKILRHRYRCTP